MKSRKKEIINFTGKNHSIKGLISFGLGLLIVIVIVVLMILSSLSAGNAGLWLGYLGFLLAILSVVGFILGMKGCKEKEIYFRAPISGIIINGVLFLMFVILYLVGAIQ